MCLTNVFLYAPPLFIKSSNLAIQKELDEINILNANLTCWQVDVTLEQNVHLIVFLTLLLCAAVFFAVGLFRHRKKTND